MAKRKKRLLPLQMVKGFSVFLIIIGTMLLLTSIFSFIAFPLLWPILTISAGLWGILISVSF